MLGQLKIMARKRNKSKKAWYTNQPTINAAKKPPSSAPLQMNTLRRIPSDFLIASPSWASGVARLVDFGCAFDAYNKSATPQEADFRAILADWIAVGFDLLEATDQVEQEKKIA
jgi:hypothetical protein